MIATLSSGGFGSNTKPVTPLASNSAQRISFTDFEQKIHHEFVEGSAIHPALYQAAVEIVRDIEVGLAGEVSTPIHDALGWHYRRFGQQVKADLFAALLYNEDHSPWQAKLSNPLIDRDSGKARRYEAVKGNGSTAYLPAVDVFTWFNIAQRHQLTGFLPSWVRYAIALQQKDLVSHSNNSLTSDEFNSCANRLRQTFAVPSPRGISPPKGFSSSTEKNKSEISSPIPPLRESHLLQTQFPIETSSFWQWVELLPVPIIWTEGAKKALCLLSHGYVAIALYGVNAGYHKLVDGTRELIADAVRFCQPGRRVVLAFDQDQKESTCRRVTVALMRFGALLTSRGCDLAIASWDGKQGKGVDDLIVQGGATAWESAYTNALPLQHWMIWQRLDKRLTYPAAIEVIEANLSMLTTENVPLSGILAIESAKGTGKTKLIHQLLIGIEKAIAVGHRIALMRNLSARLKLDYKGDLDKVNGTFINGAGYSLRVGLCVDSLLSIDPNKFRGCDLILDEIVQLIRHLLMSSTCARDGKRPALLARFRELIQVARRVIIADADLDNATLNYIKELRGDGQPVFLIRNAYQPQGYQVRFIHAPDRSAISSDLLADIQQLESGKVLFVAADSKNACKTISQAIAKSFPQLRVLVIHSETSGGECEREFMLNPDAVLQRGEYDIILCSPSVGTGVSIEAQGIIAKVYGIFTGSSSTDADMAQALSRVREPVERVVWCAKRGSNFSKVSRSTNALELKDHLRQRTSTTIQLIRSGLREDIAGEINQYDWQSDPHLNLFTKIAAEQNFSMHHLRDALFVRLKYEGNQIMVEDRESNPAMKSLFAIARKEQQEIDATAMLNADDLTLSEVLELEQKEGLGHDEALAVKKFYFKEFYCLEEFTLDDVLWDNEGQRRRELLNLEWQLFPGIATDRTAKALERQITWNQGCCPWDISGSELRRRMRSEIGLDELIEKIRSGWQWNRYDLKPYAERARQLARQIKVVLHFTIKDDMSDAQVIHQLLSQLGIKLQVYWSRSCPGYAGKKLRVYCLDREYWERLWAILQRRAEKRQRLAKQRLETDAEKGSPPVLNNQNHVGDPPNQNTTEPDLCLSEKVLSDRQAWIETLSLDSVVIEQNSLHSPFPH